MDYKYYERKLNDIIQKCPIEAGVEILVYNVLDSIVELKGLSLVDINRIWRSKDKRLSTSAGVPDIAVLSDDFVFKSNIGQALGFIEVKATNKTLSETKQVKGQKSATNHYIYTNGLVWKYYENKKLKWDIALDSYKRPSIIVKNVRVLLEEKEFKNLLIKLNDINWK